MKPSQAHLLLDKVKFNPPPPLLFIFNICTTLFQNVLSHRVKASGVLILCQRSHSQDKVVHLRENLNHVSPWAFSCTYGIYNMDRKSNFENSKCSYLHCAECIIFIKTKEVERYTISFRISSHLDTQKQISLMYLELMNLHFPDGQTGWDATAQHSALQFKMFNIAILPFLLQQPTQRQMALNSRTLKCL